MALRSPFDRFLRSSRRISALRLLLPLAAVLLVAAALAPSARAENLLVNPRFDTSISGWTVGNDDQVWSPVDVDDDPSSGSARALIDQAPGPFTGVAFRQCVEVTAGDEYVYGASTLVPSGQERTGSALVAVYFYGEEGCGGAAIDTQTIGPVDDPGAWANVSDTITAPDGSRSVNVFLSVTKNEPGGELTAHFDDVLFCSDDDCEVSATEPPYDTWISSPALPGFEAQVRITPPGDAPIEGSLETDCIDETICARGALEGRPEIFIKVIGPRPNGFLWVQLIRFTPSQVEVWLRQTASGQVNYYPIDPSVPGAGVLLGIEDREAFLP